MPASAIISFYWKSSLVDSLPCFLLLDIIKRDNPNSEKNDEFEKLSYWADNLPTEPTVPVNGETSKLIAYLKQHVKWKKIQPFLRILPNINSGLVKLWKNIETHSNNNYSITLHYRKLPVELFRYVPCNIEFLKVLFQKDELFLPSPSQFNDPFDCGFDEDIRLTFIEAAMGCFSSENNNILLFSHYADKHKGICFGIDPIRMVESISELNESASAHIRPIWYFKKLPNLDFDESKALFATCKDIVWEYEKEYRLFIEYKSSIRLMPSMHYRFSKDAIKSVTFGCNTADSDIAEIKKLTSHNENIQYFRAYRRSNKFGIELSNIQKL